MPTCADVGCSNRTDAQIKIISFHLFPKNKELNNTWIAKLDRGIPALDKKG